MLRHRWVCRPCLLLRTKLTMEVLLWSQVLTQAPTSPTLNATTIATTRMRPSTRHIGDLRQVRAHQNQRSPPPSEAEGPSELRDLDVVMAPTSTSPPQGGLAPTTATASDVPTRPTPVLARPTPVLDRPTPALDQPTTTGLASPMAPELLHRKVGWSQGHP